MSTGFALTMAPATESIMGSLPLAKAGVGSAVNDTTRQVGGALGVAVLGSIFTSIYSSRLASSAAGRALPADVVAQAKDSVGTALQVANNLGGAAGRALATAARSAFIDGFQASVRAGALVTFVGFVVTAIWLPAHARERDTAAQAVEFADEHAEVGADAVSS